MLTHRWPKLAQILSAHTKLTFGWDSAPDSAGGLTTLHQTPKFDPNGSGLQWRLLRALVPDCGAQIMVTLNL